MLGHLDLYFRPPSAQVLQAYRYQVQETCEHLGAKGRAREDIKSLALLILIQVLTWLAQNLHREQHLQVRSHNPSTLIANPRSLLEAFSATFLF